MNNFTSEHISKEGQTNVPRHLEQLTTSAFQSLFPPLNPQKTPLSSVQRVLLLNRELHAKGQLESFIINLRHYSITTKRTSRSKGTNQPSAADKLQKSQDRTDKSLPNLGRLSDVADYILKPGEDGGYTSVSESEVETDAEVEVREESTRKVLTQRQRQQLRATKGTNGAGPRTEKRAVKLSELGPRLRLRLMKVEEGMCEGKVLWHEYMAKTSEQSKEMDKVWEERRRQREQRRAEQRENILKKKAAKQAGEKVDGEDQGDDMDVDDLDDEMWDDIDQEDDAAEDDGREQETLLSEVPAG